MERSFLHTAAGQFRIFTGFPFQIDRKPINHREAKTTIYLTYRIVNPNLLGLLCKTLHVGLQSYPMA
jgi:hypothetical protein